MTTQMEYLHMQLPIDGIWHNVTMTGVPVTLTALDENGNPTNIGTATTSGYYGTFELAWTPPAEGIYRIVASFEGDDSYGSSGAATAISVGPAPSTTDTIQPVTAAFDYTPLYYAVASAAAAIIIAIAIVGVLTLRKR
jgi:hypothetical protein